VAGLAVLAAAGFGGFAAAAGLPSLAAGAGLKALAVAASARAELAASALAEASNGLSSRPASPLAARRSDVASMAGLARGRRARQIWNNWARRGLAYEYFFSLCAVYCRVVCARASASTQPVYNLRTCLRWRP
jgi:hypothetical protein